MMDEHEQRWDALLHDPRSDGVLDAMIAEARAELHAGQTADLDDFLDQEDQREDTTKSADEQ